MYCTWGPFLSCLYEITFPRHIHTSNLKNVPTFLLSLKQPILEALIVMKINPFPIFVVVAKKEFSLVSDTLNLFVWVKWHD